MSEPTGPRPSMRHADLGPAFYDEVQAAAFPQHILRFRNDRWAARVGLDSLSDARWTAHFGRFEPLPGSFPRPLALRYHGHQFGHYNPDLGDGRGFLFAQLHDLETGRLLDLGTKGSGRTPWSRAGDGKLTLNGGIREVLATEMLEALGVETSKSFSLIETGEDLDRSDEPSPTRASVLVRLSHSHIRIGSFQRLLAIEDTAGLGRLLDHVIDTYWPQARRDTIAASAVALLEKVCGAVARMGAQWMAAGFVHGVLNTDNINITGESFDYGPWRFLPVYDAGFTAAYFDHAGRYAFARQPSVLAWNLARLAECLLPLAPQAEIEASLDHYAPAFRQAFVTQTLKRLGRKPFGDERDGLVSQAFWGILDASKAPFEQVFFDLFGGRTLVREGSYSGPAFEALRIALDPMEAVPGLKLDHPYFAAAKPCTMLHDEVEAILAAVNGADDWTPFLAKIEAIRAMGEAYGLRTDAA